MGGWSSGGVTVDDTHIKKWITTQISGLTDLENTDERTHEYTHERHPPPPHFVYILLPPAAHLLLTTLLHMSAARCTGEETVWALLQRRDSVGFDSGHSDSFCAALFISRSEGEREKLPGPAVDRNSRQRLISGFIVGDVRRRVTVDPPHPSK